MQHRFHIRVSLFVYLFLLFGSFCALWLAINVEEPYKIVFSYLGFIFLISIAINLLFLQISKRGGISISSNYLYVYNIRTLIIPLSNIQDIKVGYNGNKNNMIIRYLRENKIKKIGFGQVYSDSLIYIKDHIDSVISQLQKTDNVNNTIEKDSINQQHNYKQESILCSFLSLNYLLLSLFVYIVDFIDSKNVIYIVFGIIFFVEVILSTIQYRKHIIITGRLFISFILLLCSSVFMIFSMIFG